jgi:hypothetical protein
MAKPKHTKTSAVEPSEDATVILRGVTIPIASDIGGAFISDVSRNKERLLSDQRLCEKYGITYEALCEIAQKKAVRLAVDTEYERRIRNGDAAKEAAAKFFTKAPEVLGELLLDKSANARHRIEAAKELRATANIGDAEKVPTAERFVITINLGADEKLVIDKPIAPMTPKEAKETRDAE